MLIERKVSKHGVQYRDEFYTSHLLAPHVARTVLIEPVQGTPPHVAVFDGRSGKICTAVRHCDLPPEEILAILLERRDARAEDRRWWRRRLTEIEVDARERVRASRTPSAEANTSLLDTLFRRLPGQLNQPVRSQPEDGVEAVDRNHATDPSLRTPRTALARGRLRRRSGSAGAGGSIELNRPMPGARPQTHPVGPEGRS